MKKSRIILSVFFAIYLLLTVFVSANAANGNVVKLKGNINAQTIRKVNEAVPVIYQNNVVSIIVAHKDNLLNSSYTTDEIKEATFSKPIPVFASTTKYYKNDDFKTKLTLCSWCIIAYIDGVPVSIFQIASQSEQYEYINTYNQNLATAFDNAIKQLGTDDVICLQVEVNFFFANNSDEVSFANIYGDSIKRPLVSFDAFNTACNKTINYNADNPDIVGGSPTLTYLYSSISTTNANTAIVLQLVLACGVILILAGAAFFTIRKIRIK